MAIAIDREQAGNINNPALEIINWCVEQHQEQLPRLQMLFDYYDGRPHKIDEMTEVKTPHDKDEIYVNNAKYVTDMMVGFSVGSPISYAAAKDANIDAVIDAYERMRINKHDKEMAKDISVYGIALEMQYLAKDPINPIKTVPRIASIDPRGMFLVVDDTVDRNKLFAVRYTKKHNIIEKYDYWEFNIITKHGTIFYYSKDRRLSTENILNEKTKFTEHYYGDVPVTEYRNNEEKQGDFEQQISQIDGYNKLMTERIRDKENFVKAIMIFYGFALPEDKPEKVNGNMVINAPAKEDGGDAEFLTNTFDESGVQVLADAMIDDFHKTSYVPNLNDENFSGTTSGEAMKYKLFGLLLVLATKIGYMEDGLIDRMRLISNVLNLKGEEVDVEGAKITFKPNLPINRGDIINQIKNSEGIVPLLISLGWLDDIEDPKEVIELLRQEQEEKIILNQKAMGIMNSHSDVEPDEKQEDEEESKVSK